MKALDILLKNKFSLRKNIIYEYKDSIFKSKVIGKIKDKVEENVEEIDYNNVIINAKVKGFFGNMLFVVDVGKIKKKDLEGLFKFVLKDKFHNRFLFLVEDGIEEDLFEGIRRRCSVIENEEVGVKSLGKFVEYMERIYGEVKNRKDLIVFLEDYIDDISLSDFMRDLDKIFILCIKDGKFDKRDFEIAREMKVDFFQLHKLLFNYLIEKKPENRVRLVKFFADRKNIDQKPVKMLIVNIYKVLFELVQVSSKSEVGWSNYKKEQLSKYESLPVENLLRFLVLFSKYEPELNGKNFVLMLDRLLSEGMRG